MRTEGALIQEFPSGKRETWVMPGAQLEGGDLKSHDMSHDTLHDVEEGHHSPLSDLPSMVRHQSAIINNYNELKS